MSAQDTPDRACLFESLFEIEELQRIQDAFAEATGVASIITRPDGTPVTRPSNFCRLCMDIIRKTEAGLANCYRSDAVLGRYDPDGPTIQPCLSGGLWDAGASIRIEGRHVANWLIGQVRDPNQDEESLLRYADAIGADREAFRQALAEVTVMEPARFAKIANALHLLANQLSTRAYLLREERRLLAESRLAAERLRESEERFRTIFDSINEMVFVHDPTTGAILDVNRRACEEFGYTREQMAGLSVGAISSGIPPYDQEHAETSMRKALGGTPQCFEWLARRRGGGLFWLEVTIRLASLAGVQWLLVSARDITERKRLSELMVQAEKMMSVAGLAAGMAHEINNPLSAVLQGMQVLASRLGEPTPRNEEAARQAGCSLEALGRYMDLRGLGDILESVRASATRAARVVSNMLEFSRNRQSPQEPRDMAALIEKAVELCENDYDLKKKYDFRQIAIDREYELGMPRVTCSASQMEQVFLNLLRNAAQAMAGGTCDGEPPRLELSVGRQGGQAVVVVADNGPGMEEAVRRRVFEPFYTTKEPGEGTGLGLSVSCFIVSQAHGGSMEVESAPGEGARFVIRLPL